MFDTDRKLFVQALSEVMNIEYDQKIESVPYTEPSVQHTKAIQHIMNGKTNSRSISSKKILFALILAAALLLTGCVAYIHREELKKLFVTVYSGFIDLTASVDNDSRQNTLQQYYVPTFVPEGYALYEEVTNSAIVLLKYENASGHHFIYSQILSNGSFVGLDTEENEYTTIIVNDMEVYYQYSTSNHSLVWTDGEHIFNISFSENFSDQIIQSIVSGIALKESSTTQKHE